MKKTILLLSLIFISFAAWSQVERKHELKIDALSALVLPSVEISYEYTINIHSGVGVSTFLRLDPPNDDYRTFSLAPYYRQYFYNNTGYGNKGFFIEALLQYSTGEDEEKITNTARGTTSIENYSDVGIGFGGGYKWITPNGFILEINADLGRNFKLDENSPDFFLNWGINLGYRFF